MKVQILVSLCALLVVIASTSMARATTEDNVTFWVNNIIYECRITTTGEAGQPGTSSAACWATGMTPNLWREFTHYTQGSMNLRNDIRSSHPRYNNLTSAKFDDMTQDEKCESLEKSNPEDCSTSQNYSSAPNGCSGGSPQSYTSAHRVANFAATSCNPHDICYSILGGPSKSTCDTQLRENLYAECDRAFTAYNRYTREPVRGIAHDNCIATAWAMYAGVTYVPLISTHYYENAQANTACEEWKDEMEENGCA